MRTYPSLFHTLTVLLSLFALVACGDSDAVTDGAPNDTEESYELNCEALASLFKSVPTETVSDWTGFWLCYQENSGCSGESCTFEPASLPEYVLSGDCASAGSCTIDGATVEECVEVSETGYSTIDCEADGSITITVNGLPDHAIENYASAGSIPPLLGSGATNKSYTFSDTPAFSAAGEEPTIFETAGGVYGIATNGVSIFNQFTGLGSVAVTDEIVDDCGGHPANDTYHYHAFPSCGWLTEDARLGSTGAHSGLLGLWLDGFPVLGPYGFSDPDDADSDVVRLESCYSLSACDDPTSVACYAFDQAAHDNGSCHLDRCNGRETAVPPTLTSALGDRMYVYAMTLDADGAPAFPYLPFCYQGDTVSAEGGSGPPSGGGPPEGSGPPPER
ncbi:MAG: YHYH protein [Myxococcota bacterium]